MKINKVKDVKLPSKSHELDCGLDLYLPEELVLDPFETVCIGLGLSVEVPEGTAGILAPRSSIAKKGIVCHTSIIDPGYKGEIHLIVTNCSNNRYYFAAGDRLCSLVCYQCLNVTVNPEDNRGANGLGSSGK